MSGQSEYKKLTKWYNAVLANMKFSFSMIIWGNFPSRKLKIIADNLKPESRLVTY